jgi:hypothetical protein
LPFNVRDRAGREEYATQVNIIFINTISDSHEEEEKRSITHNKKRKKQ